MNTGIEELESIISDLNTICKTKKVKEEVTYLGVRE